MTKEELKKLASDLQLEKWTNNQLRKAYSNAQKEVVTAVVGSLEEILKEGKSITLDDLQQLKKAWEVKTFKGVKYVNILLNVKGFILEQIKKLKSLTENENEFSYNNGCLNEAEAILQKILSEEENG